MRVLKHIFKTWRHHFHLQFASVVILSFSLTIVCSLILLAANTQKVLTLWGDAMQISVYISDSANQNDVAAVEDFLHKNSSVDNLKKLSKFEALNIFKEQMSSYAPDLLNDKDLAKFLPSSLQFSISSSVAMKDQLQVMQEMAKTLKKMPAVEDVSYGQEWVKNFSALIGAVNWTGLILILIVVGASGFVVANTIHTAISQRRQEIEVMELVGATKRYIRLPFIYEGASLALFASCIGIFICFAIFAFLKVYLKKQLAFLQIQQHLQFLNPATIFLIIVLSALMGALSAWFCVVKINNGWAAKDGIEI